MVSASLDTASNSTAISSGAPFRLQKLLTQRGLLALLFLAYLFLGPVAEASDIIASVLSFSFLGLLVLVVTITLFRGRALRNSISLSLRSGGLGEKGEVVGGEAARLILGLSPLRVPPFFLLRVEIEFENEGVLFPHLILTGVSSDVRRLSDEIKFPHRGEWHIKKVNLAFGDQLGLSTYVWSGELPSGEKTIRVGIPERSADTLPVVSSSTRAGDLLSHTEERLGDPFDLKQYHPSDGLKKIVWKVLARSGELISRHPESSMTPEGQVVIYGALETHEDSVAGELLSYVRKLERLDLSVHVGCRGMHGPGVHNSKELEELLVDSAWETPSRTIEGEIDQMLQEFERTAMGSKVTNLVVFCSEAYLANPDRRRRIVALGSHLVTRSILPVFFVHRSPESFQSEGTKFRSGIIERFSALIWHEEVSSELFDSDGRTKEFFSTCAQRGWEVVKY